VFRTPTTPATAKKCFPSPAHIARTQLPPQTQSHTCHAPQEVVIRMLHPNPRRAVKLRCRRFVERAALPLTEHQDRSTQHRGAHVIDRDLGAAAAAGRWVMSGARWGEAWWCQGGGGGAWGRRGRWCCWQAAAAAQSGCGVAEGAARGAGAGVEGGVGGGAVDAPLQQHLVRVRVASVGATGYVRGCSKQLRLIVCISIQ